MAGLANLKELLASSNVIEVLYVHYTPLGIKIKPRGIDRAARAGAWVTHPGHTPDLKKGMMLLDLINAERTFDEDPLPSKSYDEIVHLIKTALRPFKIIFENTYKAVLSYGTFPPGSGIKVDMGDTAWYTAAPNNGTPSLMVRTGQEFSDKVGCYPSFSLGESASIDLDIPTQRLATPLC